VAAKYRLFGKYVPLCPRKRRQVVGRENAVVAVAMATRRRDQGRELIDQLQRREEQRRGAIALGSGQAVDEVLIVDQIETLKREGRAGTTAQQPLQPRTIPGGNPHLGVQRESAVLQGEHLADVITVDQAAPMPDSARFKFRLGALPGCP
jgi:hypothetical protein